MTTMSIPRVGVLLVYFNGSSYEYLCVHQDASKLWGFPKGRLNEGEETLTEGACRELFEETGIKIYSSDLSYDNMLTIKRGKHRHYYFFKNILYKPEVNIDRYEIIDYKWMTIDELSLKNVSYFTGQIIKGFPLQTHKGDIESFIKSNNFIETEVS